MELEQPQVMLDKHDVTRRKSRVMAAFIGVALFFTYFYQGTLGYLFNDWMQWQNGEYAHGFVVVAVSVFMIWGLRQNLQQTVIRPNLLATLLVLSFSLCWMIGILLGIRIVESLSFFLLIPSLVLALAGIQVLKLLWFPLVFLLVAFPVWELFLPLLQSVAATISHQLLRLSGTTVLREDAYLIVPAGKFLVAEGCSGLRYLLAAMTFAGFYIYLERLTKWRAAIFFTIVVCAAIFANALRITTVIIAGNMTEMQHPWVHDHLMLGWYIFAGMLVPVFWFGIKFSDAEQSVQKKVATQKGRLINKKTPTYSILLPILFFALISGPLLKTFLLSRVQSSSNVDMTLSAPLTQDNWKPSLDRSRQLLQPNYPGADSVVDEMYSDGNSLVRLYIALYLQQSQGKELINVHNHLFNEEHWQAVLSQTFSSESSGDQYVEVQLKNNRGDEKLIWYWYRSAGYKTTKGIFTKLFDLYGMITGNNSTSVIMLSVEMTGLEQARSHLNSFYHSMIHQIDMNLDAVNKK